jgi:hypothetical protein
MNTGGVLCMDFDPEFELLAVGTQSGNIVFIDARHSVVVKVTLFNENTIHEKNN